MAEGNASIESLASSAIAAGCLQAVMSMVHPELVKFVSFQKERVARTDAERERNGDTPSRYSRQRPEPVDGGKLSPEQQTDLSFQLKYLRQHWHSHLRFYGLDPELPAVVQRALQVRNKVAHQSQLTLAQYEAAIANFEKLADIIECNALIRQQIRELVARLLVFSPLAEKPAAEQAETKAHTQEAKAEPTPPPASLDQILQHNYLYDEDEDENPLWMDLKLIGNDYFNEKNYMEALEAYSQALEVAPKQAVLYGNRSMCYFRLREYELAREDAEDAMGADNYENVKYYRLLSMAMMSMEDYDEAKEVCDEGLEIDPEDAVLQARRRTAASMIEKAKADAEKEKKRREQEERAEAEAAYAAATAAKAAASPVAPGKSNAKASKKKNASKKADIELAPMIQYQEVPAKWIEVHTRGSRRLENYHQGMEILVVAAKALLQVTDSIGMPDRSRLPLHALVHEGMSKLRKAGELGVAEAWFRLGVLYSSAVRKGMPLTADPYKMLECFQNAAALRPFIKPPGNRVFPHQGVAEAENELGVCYRDGAPAPVVEADPEKAFQFFLRAAEHDFPMGQYNVAVAYATGRGTAADPFAARMWTSRAAQHGLPVAQEYLGELFKKGFGGRRDDVQARQWTLAACQNKLADLAINKHGFADVGVTMIGGGEIADKFASNAKASQRGKEVFDAFYGAYLDEDDEGEGAAFAGSSAFDDEDITITKVSSYSASTTSSSSHFGRAGIYREPSAVIDAEIQSRAQAGSVTAANYLASERLLERARGRLISGDISGALRDLKTADLLWERPKGISSTSTSHVGLLSTVLREAAVSLRVNPRDADAAYVVGRWEMMSDQEKVAHWKRCAKLHPSEAAFHFYLGAAYLTLERYNDAMDAMEAALAIERMPDWLYWFASPMIGLGMSDSAMAVLKEYVSTNPPDERFVPDAYYAIGALYFKRFDNAMATVYHELGQMAESVAIRFPAFNPTVLHDTAKETLRSGMKKCGYMESSVIANVLAANMVECGFCKATIKPTQLLSHKLSKCPRRMVVCQECDASMLFDALSAHQQTQHPGASKKKKSKEKKPPQAAPARPAATPTTPASAQSASFKALTAPKLHFAGAVLEVTKGKSNAKQTVLTLQTAVGQRWTLRVNHGKSSASSAFDVAETIEEAAVNTSLLVFWRRSPPLEMIDRRALVAPMEGEVYGQDVVLYVLKCSAQALHFELCQLRHNKYVENGSLCAGCGCPPYPGKSLSACGACKQVKYCARKCQKAHWKRIHRAMCKDPVLLGNCLTMTEDVTPDERDGKRSTAGQPAAAPSGPTFVHEEPVYIDTTLEMLEGILHDV
jgi:tetratricopeptide (TPR) repeat protein